MQEASRSMPEWIASVRIATEPVTAPATSLSAISERVGDDRDRGGARALAGAAPWRRRAVSAAEPCQQRPRGAPAVGDRVLLVVGELGHRAAASPSGTNTGS